MNMKTNVIFKNGVNLVCDDVQVYTNSSFLYKHDLTSGTRIELMNESLKNGWTCTHENSSMHPNACRIQVMNDQIERFTAVM